MVLSRFFDVLTKRILVPRKRAARRRPRAARHGREVGVVSALPSVSPIERLEDRALLTVVIDGTKINDLNGNAMVDGGEPGIGGATISFYLDNGDGSFVPGANPITEDLFVKSVVTDVTGAWSSSFLPDGDYWVSQTTPFGFTSTAAIAEVVPSAVDGTDASVSSSDLIFVDQTPLISIISPDDTSSGNVFLDRESVTFTINDVTVNEAAGTLTFTVAISNPISVDATLNVTFLGGVGFGDATGGGVDFDDTTVQVTFLANSLTSQPVTVAITNDLSYEPPETFTASLALDVTTPLLDFAVTLGAAGTGTILDNDPVPHVFVSDATVVEDAGPALFTVTLSEVSGFATTVFYTLTDGTATAVVDYGNTSVFIIIPPNTLTGTISVPIVADPFDEPNETFVVTLTGAINAGIFNVSATLDGRGVGTILDDDATPDCEITAPLLILEGDVGTTLAIFTITLSAPSNLPVTATYSTANGTALSGSDYTASTGTVTFAPGETLKLITIPILGDLRDELDETFLVNIICHSNGETHTDQATATILDDDLTPTLSINNVSVTEGNSNAVTATFTVTLSAASNLPVTVTYVTADISAQAGLDYTAAGGTLTFAPGQTSKVVTVSVLPDLLDEANETFNVNLLVATNAGILVGTGLGTIVDNDPTPTLKINDVTVNEAAGTATFIVTLSAASGNTVTVNYATADGTAKNGVLLDYLATAGGLTFNPGVTSLPVTVAINNDTLDELNETFFVNLSVPGNATIYDGQGLGTITDNDAPPTLSINDVTTVGESGTASFTVSLSTASGLPVTVVVGTANGTALAGSDYTATNQTLTFAPGVTILPFNVPILSDTRDELNETFSVKLLTPTNATILDGLGIGTITDDDAAPALSITSVAVTEGTGSNVSAVFTVTLSAASGLTVTTNFATANGSAVAPGDYLAKSGTLTFTPGKTSQTITVAVVGDSLDEAIESFTVALSGPVNATGTPIGIGTITDNDPPPSLSINDVKVTEGVNSTITFTVTLSAASGQAVTVNWATANLTAVAGGLTPDYVSAFGTLTFAAGETSKTITIGIVNDATHELTETFAVNLFGATNAVIGDALGLGTIFDND